MTVLAFRRDIRSPELLSESSLTTFFRFTCLAFVTGALASLSESPESNEGTRLAGLDLERASTMDGCFTSGGAGGGRGFKNPIDMYLAGKGLCCGICVTRPDLGSFNYLQPS